jgi:hypothetical protein
MEILDRQAEMTGFQYWAKSGDFLGGMVVSFIDSDEYQNTTGRTWDAMNQEEQIEELYLALLGRASDVEGKAYWLNDLTNGATIYEIAEGFVDSIELSGMCQEQNDWNFML